MGLFLSQLQQMECRYSKNHERELQMPEVWETLNQVQEKEETF